MNTNLWKTLPALGLATLLVSARAQDSTPTNTVPQDTNNIPATSGEAPPPAENMAPPPDENAPATTDGTNATPAAAPIGAPPAADDQPASPRVHNSSVDRFVPPAGVLTNLDALRLNFHNAPLDEVLNYLSDAAGFIIVLDTPVHGTVSVMSSTPMTRDEAVDLLNGELNKNGYAAIRHGRKLTIVDKNEAKTLNIPVKVTNDPNEIPDNAEIVTEIIPIRFVEADQLTKDLSLFVSPQATIVANEGGNSIVVTDTQSNIKHLMEIIKAVDDSAEGETQIKVFKLNYASPTDVANELSTIFPSNNGSSGASTSPVRFGGGPGGFFARMMGGGGGFPGGGGGGGGGGTAASGSSARMQKQSQVLATPDLRTSSVIVTASKDLMEGIKDMMAELDVPSPRDQKVYVYHMDNADPYQALNVLQGMFSGTGSSSGSRTGSSGSTTTTSLLQSRSTQNSSTEGVGSSTTSTGSTAGGGRASGGGGGGGF